MTHVTNGASEGARTRPVVTRIATPATGIGVTHVHQFPVTVSSRYTSTTSTASPVCHTQTDPAIPSTGSSDGYGYRGGARGCGGGGGGIWDDDDDGDDDDDDDDEENDEDEGGGISISSSSATGSQTLIPMRERLASSSEHPSRASSNRMPIPVLALTLLTVLAIADPAASQRCEPWNGYPGGCTRLGYTPGMPIYIPENQTQNGLAGNNTYWAGFLPLVLGSKELAQVPIEIRREFVRASYDLECHSWLRPCAIDPATGTAYPEALPVQPCTDQCRALVEISTIFLPIIGVPLTQIGVGMYQGPNATPINCTGWVTQGHPTPGMPFFPADGHYNATLASGTDVAIACSPLTNASIDSLPGCDDGFAEVDYECQVVCPMPGISSAEYDSLDLMEQIFFAVTLLLFCAFGVTTVAYFVAGFERAGTPWLPRLRPLQSWRMWRFYPSRGMRRAVFPGIWVSWAACCAMALSASLAATRWVGRDDMWCEGGATFSVWKLENARVNVHGVPYWLYVDVWAYLTGGTLCALQGYAVYTCTLGMCASVVAVFVALLQKAFHEQYLRVSKWRAYRWAMFPGCEYAAFFLTVLLVNAAGVVLAANGLFVFGAGSAYCFISPTETAWVGAFWQAPLLCLLAVLVVLAAAFGLKIVWLTYVLIGNGVVRRTMAAASEATSTRRGIGCRPAALRSRGADEGDGGNDSSNTGDAMSGGESDTREAVRDAQRRSAISVLTHYRLIAVAAAALVSMVIAVSVSIARSLQTDAFAEEVSEYINCKLPGGGYRCSVDPFVYREAVLLVFWQECLGVSILVGDLIGVVLVAAKPKNLFRRLRTQEGTVTETRMPTALGLEEGTSDLSSSSSSCSSSSSSSSSSFSSLSFSSSSSASSCCSSDDDERYGEAETGESEETERGEEESENDSAEEGRSKHDLPTPRGDHRGSDEWM